MPSGEMRKLSTEISRNQKLRSQHFKKKPQKRPRIHWQYRGTSPGSVALKTNEGQKPFLSERNY